MSSLFPASRPVLRALAPASGLHVYPPENTESAVTPFPVEACGNPRIHQLEIQGLGA